MSTITLPTSPGHVDDSFGLIRADASLELMSGSEVIVSSRKAIWVYTFTLPRMKIADARLWQSRLVQLSKLGNSFLASPTGYTVPSTGVLSPAIQVNAAGQLGLTLGCKGAPISSQILKEGDYFSVNGELKISTADIASDAGGFVWFAFEPALRSSPAANAAVTVSSPTAAFRLVSPQANWSIDNMMNYGLSVQAQETFP
jgi:hypothetical protein